MPSDVKATLSRRYAPGTTEHLALTCVQRWLRGWFTRFRGYPRFLDQLVGKNVRSIVVYMHGSGGMVWGNGRLPRVCAGFGCVVFCPDTMATDEGRARHLRPLHTCSDDTDYWDNNLFYAGKKEALGESMELSTTVEDVLARSDHFKGVRSEIEGFRSQSDIGPDPKAAGLLARSPCECCDPKATGLLARSPCECRSPRGRTIEPSRSLRSSMSASSSCAARSSISC